MHSGIVIQIPLAVSVGGVMFATAIIALAAFYLGSLWLGHIFSRCEQPEIPEISVPTGKEP